MQAAVRAYFAPQASAHAHAHTHARARARARAPNLTSPTRLDAHSTRTPHRVQRNDEDEVHALDFGGMKLEHRQSVAIAVRNAVKLGGAESERRGGMIDFTIEIYLRCPTGG
jgi:hypothetical protein